MVAIRLVKILLVGVAVMASSCDRGQFSSEIGRHLANVSPEDASGGKVGSEDEDATISIKSVDSKKGDSEGADQHTAEVLVGDIERKDATANDEEEDSEKKKPCEEDDCDCGEKHDEKAKDLGKNKDKGNKGKSKKHSDDDPLPGELACLKAFEGEKIKVVKVTKGQTSLTLSQDAVVVVDVAGNPSINFKAAANATSIKGLCLSATGNASIVMDANLAIESVHYYGRGNASTLMNFGKSGMINGKFAADISGSHSLKIVGEAFDCAALSVTKKGHASFVCEGKK